MINIRNIFSEPLFNDRLYGKRVILFLLGDCKLRLLSCTSKLKLTFLCEILKIIITDNFLLKPFVCLQSNGTNLSQFILPYLGEKNGNPVILIYLAQLRPVFVNFSNFKELSLPLGTFLFLKIC